MQNKNNGWKQPEEKFPEAELEDSFSGFFSAEEEASLAKGKHRRRSSGGPDILAVADEQDEGFIIKEVVAVGEENGAMQAVKPAEEASAEEPAAVPVPEQPNCEEPVSAEEQAPAAAEEDRQTDGSAEENGAAEESEEAPEQPAEAEENNAESKEKAEEAFAEKPKKQKKVLFARAKKVIKKKRSHRYVAAVGAVLIALAIVGAISVVSLGVRLVGRIIDNTDQKEAFEWKIYPVLMLDPATFDDPANLDNVFLLKTAMWSTLLEHRTVYKYDEEGMLLVPASDLDVAAKKLYGDSVLLQHQTFSEEYEYFYRYDPDTNTYLVPVSSQTASYTPKVVKISKNGDIYTLIVGYVEPSTLWTISEDGSFTESIPSKYLYYDLQRVKGGNFIIKSIRNIPLEELPDDLEVASQQSLNQTHYIDYNEEYQQYLAEQQEKLYADKNFENTPEQNSSAAESTPEQNSSVAESTPEQSGSENE